MTQNDWIGKEAEIQQDFIWGVGPETLYQITRAEYKTEPDSIPVKDLIRLFKNISYRNEIHITTGENSSGLNRPKQNHPKISGGG